MSSVWTFAAAIVLPPGQASLLVAALALQRWLGKRKIGARLYRHVVTWVAILLAVQCASGTLTTSAHAWSRCLPAWRHR